MMAEKSRMELWVEQMRELQSKSGDTQINHSEADKILCECLRSLGCERLVQEWERVPKWYA